MSELKARRAYFSEDEYERGEHKICAKVSDCGYDRKNDWWSYAFEDEVYLKSEADKVIAELEDKLQAANEQIENLINSASSIMLFQDRVKDDKCAELRHQKYKRCLAMAKTCQLRAERYERYLNEYKNCDSPSTRRWQFLKKKHYEKWFIRWLELAEKFKEAK